MKSHKTRKQRNTVWCSGNRNDNDNINEPVQLYIAYHLPDAVKFLQVIPLKPFFMMRGNGSLGYWSRNTIHYYYHHCNKYGESSEEEGIEVSLDDERR